MAAGQRANPPGGRTASGRAYPVAKRIKAHERMNILNIVCIVAGLLLGLVASRHIPATRPRTLLATIWLISVGMGMLLSVTR